jgi:predicted nucleic acid-binding Zn ribbon protein
MMPDFEIFGIPIIRTSLQGTHALMVGTWLVFDFVVYWLHFDIKNPAVPLHRRIERAQVMHGIDRVVAYIFLLTLPIGIALSYATGTDLFTTNWLNWKHVGYGVIVVAALVLIPISGTALRSLEAIKAGGDADALNREIKRNMNFAMPVVFLVWILIIVLSVLSLLNLKTPPDQEYIFRKTGVNAKISLDFEGWPIGTQNPLIG